MDEATYRADERPSVTQLAKLLQMPPLHARHEWQKPPTPAMEFGTAVHTAILESDEFEHRYVAAPQVDRRTKAGKADWTAFEAQNEGKIILSAEDHGRATTIAGNVFDSEADAYLQRMDQVEVPLFGKLHGVPFKGRPDAFATSGVMRGVMVEIKTTSTLATRRNFEKSIADFGYGFQAAGYRILAEQNGHAIRHMLYVVCETKPPFGVALFRMMDEVVDWYRPRVEEAIDTYHYCIRTNSWPGHPNEIQEVGLPAWHEASRQLA